LAIWIIAVTVEVLVTSIGYLYNANSRSWDSSSLLFVLQMAAGIPVALALWWGAPSFAARALPPDDPSTQSLSDTDVYAVAVCTFGAFFLYEASGWVIFHLETALHLRELPVRRSVPGMTAFFTSWAWELAKCATGLLFVLAPRSVAGVAVRVRESIGGAGRRTMGSS